MLSAISMPVGHFLHAIKKNIPNEKSCGPSQLFRNSPGFNPPDGRSPPEKKFNVGSRRGRRHDAHRRGVRRARDVRLPDALHDHRDRHRDRDLLHAQVLHG
jgi:hypothetical protein